MKVMGYIRVSTDGQEASGLGLTDQTEKIRAYCSLYDLELVEIHKDAASGKNLLRSGLQDALSALRRGEAEGLVVAKLDRLTRSVRDMGGLLDEYFRDAFDLFVVAEQIDTRTASGRFVLNLLTSVAEWERETIGERTRAALTVKKSKGEKLGGKVPFGFNVTEDGRLVENPEEQATMTKILNLRAKGYSFQRIADTLNRDGVFTKTGKPWSFGTVANVLKKAA
jgi:DNA invertase Pin-like site-specific DNA recombinase